MGALFCLLSAACFGAMAIFGKYAYDARVDVADLLLLRFVIAAVLLLVVARATGALRNLPRRSIAGALAMGGIGYATQSGLFFGALQRMDASLLALILYAYPTLVMLGAIALGRERASVRRVVALVIASVGTVLVLGAAAAGGLDALGTAMGFGAAIAYTVYILVGDRLGPAIPPLALAALVCTGAVGTFGVVSLVRGGPELGFDAAGWGWVSAIAVVSTVAAIVLFFAGVARVGPSTASILSTLEPVVTVALAAAVFHESLGAVQLAGGALVLTAAVVIQPMSPGLVRRWRGRSVVGGGEEFGDAAAGRLGAQGFAAGVEAAADDAGVVAEQQEASAEQGERRLAVFAEVSLEAAGEGDEAVVADADRCRQ
ncbi:DMT family transporter [Kribbella monticola]|uniref:DMT family transporter n=1 Tax=Kribbella monticola TaxID=2185285 RepID=UPI001E5818E4|nr:DMT family transporter [Kribbella monticola]